MNNLKFLFSVLLLSLLVACGQQSAAVPTPVHVDMSVRVEPEPLAVGETTLIVTLKDASDFPIDSATLQIHGDMDHKGMTPVDHEVNDSVNGEYLVPFVWTMGGGWIVTITARLPGNSGEVTETFDFFVEAVSSESVINHQNGMELSDDAAINIAYQPDNDPARGGDATVTITLTDGDGSPITDATVEITGDMAHEGMTPIAGVGEHTGSGQYVVPLRWTMAGDWIVTVKITLTDERHFRQTFEQQVVVP